MHRRSWYSGRVDVATARKMGGFSCAISNKTVKADLSGWENQVYRQNNRLNGVFFLCFSF